MGHFRPLFLFHYTALATMLFYHCPFVIPNDLMIRMHFLMVYLVVQIKYTFNWNRMSSNPSYKGAGYEQEKRLKQSLHFNFAWFWAGFSYTLASNTETEKIVASTLLLHSKCISILLIHQPPLPPAQKKKKKTSKVLSNAHIVINHIFFSSSMKRLFWKRGLSRISSRQKNGNVSFRINQLSALNVYYNFGALMVATFVLIT